MVICHAVDITSEIEVESKYWGFLLLVTEVNSVPKLSGVCIGG